jgi:hypothetical protein
LDSSHTVPRCPTFGAGMFAQRRLVLVVVGRAQR